MDIDRRTRDELISSCDRLVWHIARKYGRRDDLQDVAQVGYMGLVRAANRFDRSLGVPFSAFASRAIVNQIFSYLRTVRSWRQCAVAEGCGDSLPLDDVCDRRRSRWQLASDMSEMRELVRHATAGLNPNPLAIMRLRFVSRRSYQQIADELGFSTGYVKKVISVSKPRVQKRICELLGS